MLGTMLKTLGSDALTFDYSGVYNGLSEEVLERLRALGVDAADANSLSKLSFENVMGQMTAMAGESLQTPFKSLLTVTAALILCAMLSAYQNSLSGDISAAVQTVASLCVACAVAVPAVGFIGGIGGVISTAANLFLAYIPIVAVMMATAGKGVSAASYQTSMLAVGQGVTRVFADVLLPLMNVFLGLSITAGISPEVRLKSLTAMLAKAAKWVLAFVMSVFTAVLSVRGAAAGAVDSVASRTARFALSSFVPVVGGALSEAYQSVKGSIHLLKSGLGIFVILAIILTFLPVILQAMGWSLCLAVGRTLAETMGVDGCAGILESLNAVFSTLLAMALCVAAVFVIATAAAFTVGSDGA